VTKGGEDVFLEIFSNQFVSRELCTAEVKFKPTRAFVRTRI
jgi:hypothetical protein